ncbi:universal stress protein [Pseudooceanicola sp. LIPI14-2-Ac024]|uniref:universal stress protein n=1 Tax=Pseudooceanicola sp. LIPI14-2-Ac024 TaxID=3344875 RepID=UPI0035CEF75E
MINTILCAVDVNRLTEEAEVLRRAAKIAEVEGAQLDLITVIPNYGKSMVGGYFSEDHTKKAVAKAKDLLSDFGAQTLGDEVNDKVRHIVAVGSVYHEVLTVADKDKADLIVLGAHRPDLSDYLLGPNAARVVRHAKASVYVVR